MSERWATFDCYGTLIDWNRGIRDALASLWPAEDADDLLAHHHRLEPSIQHGSSMPYREVLSRCARRIATERDLPLANGAESAVPDSLPSWPPFPDVPDALRELRQRGWRLAILSNTDPDLLDASIAALAVEIDLRITVTQAGSYKPAPGHWEAFFETTACPRASHVHVGASIFHDLEPCATMGLRSVWINRLDEHSSVERAGELGDLSGLPDLLDRLV